MHESVVWDPTVLLCYSRTPGGRRCRAWAGNQPRGFVYRSASTKGKALARLDEALRSVFLEQPSLHSVDLKPLKTLFYSLLLPAWLLVTNYTLTQDWTNQISKEGDGKTEI